MNPHQTKVFEMLESSQKVIAMLAPSFVIDFPHPKIVNMLEKLGFEKVTELTFGARMTNYWYREYIQTHQEQKIFIASPCPTVVAFIQKMYPKLNQYLIPYASPMYAMAKICRKEYPDYKIVFVSPCQAKRILEAPRYPDFIDAVITFRELQEMFDEKAINPEDFSEEPHPFDSFITERTKIYPMSGGLARTAHVRNFFQPDEICVTDGVMNNKKVLDDLNAGISPYRFIDILNCPGGCIGGPDIINKDLTHEEKDRMIIEYRNRSIIDHDDGTEGRKEFVLDIDFGARLDQ